jgi:hypothetical protein
MNRLNIILPLYCFIVIINLLGKKVEGIMSDIAEFIVFMATCYLCYLVIFDKKRKS